MGIVKAGAPGFGLRRQLIDEKGNPKGELAHRQHKSIQTDRVVLVPGPLEEVDTVREIYEDFVHRELSEVDIAVRLNLRGILTDLGRPWTRGTVHQILINEKYIGNKSGTEARSNSSNVVYRIRRTYGLGAMARFNQLWNDICLTPRKKSLTRDPSA